MVKCTRDDVAGLQDVPIDPTSPVSPVRPGPLSKLLLAADEAKNFTFVDRERIKRFAKPLLAESREIDLARLELLKKYGEASKDNAKVFNFKSPADRLAYNGELQALGKDEIEIPILPLPAATYEKIPTLNASDLLALEKFVEPIKLPEDELAQVPPAPEAAAK